MIVNGSRSAMRSTTGRLNENDTPIRPVKNPEIHLKYWLHTG